jgi:tripartite ATP-independent transporter DctM subunit
LLSNTLLPDMVKRGYEKKLSMTVIFAGGTIDVLIPPSNFAILVGMLANVSIAKLLIAGVLPGLLYTVLFMIYVFVAVRMKPELAPIYLHSSTFREKMLSLLNLLPFGIIIFLVLGLMMMGIATPTESAAVGVLASLVLATCARRMSFQVLKIALLGSIRITAMILLIIAGSKAFSQILAVSGASRNMLEIVAVSGLSPLAIFLVMNLVTFIMACFIDQVSIMMIAIPIFAPIVVNLGFDPIWFWILFLINMAIGGITPPFGMRLFTLHACAPTIPLNEVFLAGIPPVFMLVLGIVIIYIFPQIALWLPNLFLK